MTLLCVAMAVVVVMVTVVMKVTCTVC